MKKNIRIAISQINTTVGAIDKNCAKILDQIHHAKNHNVDIICFPELTITGYPPEDLLHKPRFLQTNIDKLNELAQQIHDTIVIVGFANKINNQIFNAAAILHNQKIQGIYHKFLLPNYSVFDENRYFKPGSELKLFHLDGLTFGTTICEDIWNDNGPLKQLADNGTDFVFNINASPFHLTKIQERENLVCKQAKQNNIFIIYNNLVGAQDELVFDGHSIIVDNNGKILTKGASFKEELIITDLDIPCKNKKPQSAITLDKKRNIQSAPMHHKTVQDLPELEAVYQALVLGLKDYVTKNNFKKVIFGLSGGIDSAFVAAIATDALGPENIIAVSMPSQYSSDNTQQDAEQLAINLGIEFHVIPIKKTFDAYLQTLEPFFKDTKPNIAEENIQARIRGNLLMALSNKFDYIVLACGNKSETSVGYCTLYGDMAGGFSVIKDVPKTLVYKLCEYKNSLSDTELIPESIISRPPTAELRADQKDSDSLPDYKILDPILEAYVENDMCQKEIADKLGYDENLTKDIIRLVDKNEYKRRQAPIGIKITPKAFGKDRRMPIVNGFSV